MKKNKWLYFITIVLTSPVLLGWGAFGHEHINHAAVMALPAPLQQFFYDHIDFITLEATVPDLRKYTLNDRPEFARHFINLENYEEQPLPSSLTEAKKNYPDSFLQKNGILPWYIEDVMEKLTTAFREKRKTEILFLAADLGHYLGDANMPLHNSVNHNGQLSGQTGIHALWESQLPEMFGEKYNYYTGGAKYITDIKAETWRIIEASNKLADTLLSADRTLREQFNGKNIYETDTAGAVLKNKFNDVVFTKAYARQYHSALKGMIEKQLRSAVSAAADFWYTAWVNAGKPILSELDPAGITRYNAIQLKKEITVWRKGRLYGVKSDPEFKAQ